MVEGDKDSKPENQVEKAKFVSPDAAANHQEAIEPKDVLPIDGITAEVLHKMAQTETRSRDPFARLSQHHSHPSDINMSGIHLLYHFRRQDFANYSSSFK
jgi:hypothetical protein